MSQQTSGLKATTHGGKITHYLQNNEAEWEKVKNSDTLSYHYGYGSEIISEALPNAVPVLGNTPLRCPYNLYAEQISGTSFTTPRVHNKKTWVYKIRPTAAHPPFKPYKGAKLFTNDFTGENGAVNPNQLRWKPFPIPSEDIPTDFIDGLITLMGAGEPSTKSGCAIHVYCCNISMTDRAFCNADGDLLIVPQQTPLLIVTEMGKMRVAPGEFSVIPRGIKFAVHLDTLTGKGASRGYICEVYDSHFVIPDLGPIGANGLANPRHFAVPTASYENIVYNSVDSSSYDKDLKIEVQGKEVRSTTFTYLHKFLGKVFETTLETSPFDIVGWTGSYYPVKYDLAFFNTINSVSYDHIDPSIFTVLTAQTNSPGVAALDFVVFPPRMAVQEDTFRPPYYHRNCMSEFMGNIMGQYDAKPEGFVPGSASLHSCMAGHGPDADTYKKFSNRETAPAGPVLMSKNDLAFMFESTYLFKLTKWANEENNLQTSYYKCWATLQNEFTPESK